MIFVRDFLTDQIVLRGADAPQQPVVSVILPTYSRCQNGMLERSITSVLSQTFDDFELIVMDDGSMDGSYDLIERLRARDPRLVHVRHDRNCGLPALRVNEGIELARGRYLAFQFDDDQWLPNALQALTTEAGRQAEAAVIVGHCRRGGAEESVLPYVEVNQVTLSVQNRLANNSVLFARGLVERYGMYDCHLGMRRLCDWDLWLRYVKHVPFIVIDAVVSNVFENNDGAIGRTVPWDPPFFRYLQAIPRDHLLVPGRWRDYEVDSLSIGTVPIPGDFRRRLHEEHIVPYYFKMRHAFPQVEGFQAAFGAELKTVLLTKAAYDVSNDVTLNHYDPLSSQRGTYKAFFQPLSQVTPDWPRDVDGLLLVRTVEDQAKQLLEQGRLHQKPVGYYLDDDLLNFYKFGPEYGYLAPGKPYHDNLTALLRDADAVWVTNRFIEDSVRAYAQRIIPHNNSIPLWSLPDSIRPRPKSGPLRIGYVGTGYRIEEFHQIWDALVRIAREFPNQVQFEFWGLDVGDLPALAAAVSHQPFTFSYFNYLRRLSEAHFDILLAPLLEQPQPRLAKSLIKYYETAVAGAFGIFSSVPPYASLPAGLTCLKADNTAEAWYQALREALLMPADQFDRMRQRLLEHVREEYSEYAQIHLHEAAWRATEFHALTRQARGDDGRPRVMYFLHSAIFGGGELQLWRRLRLARRYGIEPIVVLMKIIRETEPARAVQAALAREHIQLEFADFTCFTEPRSPAEYWSEPERQDLRDLLLRCQPALVHSVTFIPSLGQMCMELNVPHVASLYAVEEEFAWPAGRPGFKYSHLVQSDSFRYSQRWCQLLEAPKYCAREVVPEEVFRLGQTRYLEGLGQPAPEQPALLRLAMAGTLQERKRQLETIEAVGRLSQEELVCQLDLYGYTHFFPRYLEQCQDCIHKYGLEEHIRLAGFSDNVVDILKSTDIVLSFSTHESFPSAIKEAMAAGVLVVATPVGGIRELIIDGISGILCEDTSVEALMVGIRRALSLSPAERQRIVAQARRVARTEFHPHRAANDLLFMYRRVLELATTSGLPVPAGESVPPAGAGLVVAGPAGRLVMPTTAPKGYVRVVRDIRFTLLPGQNHWMGLELQLITRERPPDGTLALQIQSSSGQLLRQTAINLLGYHDYDWLKWHFEPIANSGGVAFSLIMSLSGAGPETVVAFYETGPLEHKLLRAARRMGIPLPGHNLYSRMWYAGQDYAELMLPLMA